MEKLWDQVQRSISNAVWQTLDAIESEIVGVVGVLQPFWQSVSRVHRFLGENWLTRGVGTKYQPTECSSTNRLGLDTLVRPYSTGAVVPLSEKLV